MNKISSLFMLFTLALTFFPQSTYAQRRTVITENLQRHVRMHEQLRLSQLFRLFPQEARNTEILSLKIVARAYQAQGTQFQVLEHGRVVMGGLIRLHRTELRLPFRSRTMIDNLSLNFRGDMFIESIQAEVIRPYRNEPPQRVYLRQHLARGAVFSLDRVLPYENRLVRAITVEASSRPYNGRLQLTTRFGEVIAGVEVTQFPTRPRVELFRPIPLRELQLRSVSSGHVMLDALEIEFDRPRY